MDIFSAIESGDSAAVRAVLLAGVDLREPGLADTTPLVEAIEKGHEEIVAMLLSAGADPNFGYCASPLGLACAKGALGIVDKLLRAGADPNGRDTDGDYCLSSAVFSGSVPVVEAIIAAGASPDAFHQARRLHERGWPDDRDRSGVIRVLLDHWPAGPTLTDAAAAGNAATVGALLEAGADPDYSPTAAYPLIAAAGRGHLEIVDMLIVAGASANMMDQAGRTPLMSAAAGGHLEVVRRLLRAVAKPKAKNRAGLSAVVCAAEMGHRDIVELLAPLSDPEAADRALRLLNKPRAE